MTHNRNKSDHRVLYDNQFRNGREWHPLEEHTLIFLRCVSHLKWSGISMRMNRSVSSVKTRFNRICAHPEALMEGSAARKLVFAWLHRVDPALPHCNPTPSTDEPTSPDSSTVHGRGARAMQPCATSPARAVICFDRPPSRFARFFLWLIRANAMEIGVSE